MPKPPVDLALYLVTGRGLLPPGKDYYESLEESLQGGVTLVQVREKKADTAEFLEVAVRTVGICNKYNVPVLINDRIDICLASGAAGVHLGQTDMPISIARQLLPKDAIIGISAGNVDEARVARDAGADYVGIGALWWTESKQLVKDVLGVRGVGAILDVLAGSPTRSVAIGGIKSTNLLRSMHGAVGPDSSRTLDGVAVISEIVGSTTPKAAAANLKKLITAFLGSSPSIITIASGPRTPEALVSGVVKLFQTIREETPIIHQITNNVTINSLANITIALRASPIMATTPAEMEDLAKIGGALLVNFGTITDKAGMLAAGHHYNRNKKPIVFDPVGVGATAYRKAAAKEILNTWQATVIKGNGGEIGSLYGSSEVASRGVDSVGQAFSDPAKVVRELARRERCVVVMTGKHDYVSDGEHVLRLSNGHELLENITGAGCMAGSCVAAFCAAARLAQPEPKDEDGRLVRGDMLVAAIGGILALSIASEFAAARTDVHGSGTFLPALIDEVYNLTPEKLLSKAKIEVLQ
ncbi:HK-domain-containing protein [Calocera cornea HHB12733]|uniref:HK-domain-containing protein n=1 Tax=Calocera cornea HHB12733 TaxID=1353952 RepID=A0A165GWR6_9BASI|nr:HK-domain-containing protein [Calocera cornea HHB12733]